MVTLSYRIITLSIFFGIIIFISLSIIKVKENEVYIIERNGKFYKVKKKGIIFLIPFLDKVKNVLNLDNQIIDCLAQPIILKSGKVIFLKFNIHYHIIDPIKITYEVQKSEYKDLESNIIFFSINYLRKIAENIDNEEFEYLKKYFTNKLKDRFWEQEKNEGYKVDNIEIELFSKFNENVKNK